LYLIASIHECIIHCTCSDEMRNLTRAQDFHFPHCEETTLH